MTEKRIEIYRGMTGEVVFDVDAEGETIWATQEQMAQVFGTDLSVISRHLKNIYAEGELKEGPESLGELSRTLAKNASVGGVAGRVVGECAAGDGATSAKNTQVGFYILYCICAYNRV